MSAKFGSASAGIARRSFEKPHEARIDFADRADELHDAFGLAFPAFRCFENLPHAPAHVGFDCLREHCLRGELRIEIGQSGQDGINEKLNPRMLPCAMDARVDRCGDCAAICVAEDDEERRLQMAARVLQAPYDFRRYHISRDPDDEQVTKAGIEDQLGWHAGVAATENGGIRMLALKEICEDLLLHGGESRGPGDKPRVPRFQALQGVAGRRCGIGNRAHAGYQSKNWARLARASREILYFDGFQSANVKLREQSFPPTGVVGFGNEARVTEDRSSAVNIDADRALISFKEMPIPRVDANHHPVEVAGGKIGGLAVERAALINDFELGQNPALRDTSELEGFIWEPN